MTSIRTSLRGAVAAATLLTGVAGVATNRAHADGANIVIAFRDVTTLGHCGIGFGRTPEEAAVPKVTCPAGTVWERESMTLAAAQAQHLPYISPVLGADGKTVDNALTLRAEYEELQALSPSAATPTARANTVSPMVSCSGGPYYQNMIFGNGSVSFVAKARWFEQVSGGTCNFNQVNDQIQQTGGSTFVEKWNYSWLDDTTSAQHQVSRGCTTIPFNPGFTSWQGGWSASYPNADWKTEADQTGGGCGNWFDTYISGDTHLLEQ